MVYSTINVVLWLNNNYTKEDEHWRAQQIEHKQSNNSSPSLLLYILTRRVFVYIYIYIYTDYSGLYTRCWESVKCCAAVRRDDWLTSELGDGPRPSSVWGPSKKSFWGGFICEPNVKCLQTHTHMKKVKFVESRSHTRVNIVSKADGSRHQK